MMSRLEASHIHGHLSEETNARLDDLETFASIDSTNSYLMSQSAPAPGRFRVAIADEQTQGRGRHNRQWISPQGSGLYLSIAYSFANMPGHLPGLTLALGVGVIEALARLDVDGVSLKWPNDIVARDSKLGGILTEVHSGTSKHAVVVSGIGLNLNLPDDLELADASGWAHKPIDLAAITDAPPASGQLAGTIIESIQETCTVFESGGFAAFSQRWRNHDWLLGREITVDTPGRQVSGTAQGVDDEGALLIGNSSGQARIVSGSIVLAGHAGRSD